MTKTIRVAHLARVEGHGGILVEMDGDAVTRVEYDIFEGARLLEGLVRGRSFTEVSQIVSRICAICSVAHALTSLKATEACFGVEPSAQTLLLRELMFLGENIESHALHLFLLAVPDYLGYPGAVAMAADHPDAVQLGLRLKRLGNTIQEAIGGRAVHPVNAVPGGFGRLPGMEDLIALHQALRHGAADGAAALDLVASLPPAEFCHSATAFAALRGGGYYAGDEVIVLNGKRETIAAPDYRSFTNERPVPYAHAKHSTFRGQPFMVGALARLTANPERGSELASKLALRLPSENPMDNNKAQAVELMLDLRRALEIVERLLGDGLREEPPVAIHPRAGSGVGITEAPRGLLIHSYTYDAEGRLAAADVITPTALNAASVEERFRRAVEQSADKDIPALTRKLEMIARAYDPCLSCSVHLVRKAHAG